jgi:hypothetical protein
LAWISITEIQGGTMEQELLRQATREVMKKLFEVAAQRVERDGDIGQVILFAVASHIL